VEVRRPVALAEAVEHVELRRGERHAGEPHRRALAVDHREPPQRDLAGAAPGVALEHGRAVLAGGDDRQLVCACDLVEPRGADLLEVNPPAAALERAQPLGALQPQIDRERGHREAAEQREHRLAGVRADRHLEPVHARRVVVPVRQAEPALVRQRPREPNGGTGRPPVQKPVLGRTIRVQLDVMAGLQ